MDHNDERDFSEEAAQRAEQLAEQAAEAYTPDAEASSLDASVLLLAQRLHRAGWAEEAEQLGAAMAYLRETPRHLDADPSPSDVHEALMTIAENATGAAEVIANTFPDRFALSAGDR